ncbi:hypothetical protein [Streptomonospora salina]|uniref:Uncharacterized protein n=1 Tax=Streptomonospora salina TaxID=104205 RepID=A0A841EID7_9ACTN|nr:hypothetical protein [Streptomonospora salina]MBB6000120.1 hypothetical protein [Streptomonospora salina]
MHAIGACGALVQAAPMRPAGLHGVSSALVIDTAPGDRRLVWWFGLGPPQLVATVQTVPVPEMRPLGPVSEALGPAARAGLRAAAARTPEDAALADRARAALE